MQLETEFFKLPVRFDVARLAEEVRQFAEEDWRGHPQGHAGNTAVALIAIDGNEKSDSVKGPMRPTKHLQRCPYIQQVLAGLNSSWGRTRLMRIAGNAEATRHVDTNYYWLQRIRVHVPIITFPEVIFECGAQKTHMAAGDCWIFDTWRMHNVYNVPEPRIHLVADTVGSATLWDLIGKAEQPFGKSPQPPTPVRFIPYEAGKKPEVTYETYNFPVVMTPWEQEYMLAWFFGEMAHTKSPADALANLEAEMKVFKKDWRNLWAAYGTDEAGWPAYRDLLKKLDNKLNAYKKLHLPNGMDVVEIIRQAIIRPGHTPEIAKGTYAQGAAPEADYKKTDTPAPASPPAPAPVAVAPTLAPAPVPTPTPAFTSTQVESTMPAELKANDPASDLVTTIEDKTPRVVRPIIIVSAPRSGSTLLFETLARSPSVWTVGGESHMIIEGLAKCDPQYRKFDSNRLTAADADAETVGHLHNRFVSKLIDRDKKPLPTDAGPIRMLEKTPKNALRVPFFNAAYPDAMFIFLYREAHENLSSIIEAWKSRKFITYPRLPGWTTTPWSLLLIPGWRELIGKDVSDIASRQWSVTNQTLLDDLQQIPRERWTTVTYSELVADPQATAERLCAFAGIDWDQNLNDTKLPLSRHTLTAPDPNKWKKNAVDLKRILPEVEPVAAKMRTLTGATKPLLDLDAAVAEAPAKTEEPAPKVPATPAAPAAPARAAAANGAPAKAQGGKQDELYMGGPPPAGTDGKVQVRSAHSGSFVPVLEKLGISLLVTTYQAGKVIAIRASEGKLNTHFRSFRAPMGLAADRRRLAIGTKTHVWEFRNQPQVGQKLEPVGKHDACYLPRAGYVTGDIRIHEIAFADNDLWIVNTRFSCLCTVDRDHSFVPKWRPNFVSALAAEDRCHLNGMCLMDGKPRYVTALGKTDTPGGWRENKAKGGIIIDVKNHEIVADGLCMPHSPRWYRDKLWVMESGDGNLGWIDPKTKKVVKVAEFNGFTRGLDFFNNLAFIGLSQVRETGVFSGLPLTNRLVDRTCGIWVVDITNGRTVAFLRFDSGVQEIFAVQVLPNIRFPEIILDDDKILSNSFVLPDAALKDVPRRRPQPQQQLAGVGAT